MGRNSAEAGLTQGVPNVRVWFHHDELHRDVVRVAEVEMMSPFAPPHVAGNTVVAQPRVPSVKTGYIWNGKAYMVETRAELGERLLDSVLVARQDQRRQPWCTDQQGTVRLA